MIKIKRNPNTRRSINAPPLIPETNKEFLKCVKQAIDHLTEIYGKPFKGRHRIVFIDHKNDEVLKVPSQYESGIAANFQELDIQGKHLAKTKLDEQLSVRFGIPIIRMELVQEAGGRKNQPSWVNYIDCQQVGYTKDGRLVAYDWDTF